MHITREVSMRRIEVVYGQFAERVLNSSWEGVPQELEMILSLPYRIQKMCIGDGKGWERECPKYLRGKLDKELVVRNFARATRMLAVVSLNPMFVATVTLRFFEGSHVEDSFYEVTVNLSRSGKTMVGEIRTTQQLYGLIMS